jgi:hypothetical protein
MLLIVGIYASKDVVRQTSMAAPTVGVSFQKNLEIAALDKYNSQLILKHR